MDQRVQQDLKDIEDLLAPQDSQEAQAQMAQMEKMVYLEFKVHQVPLVNQGRPDGQDVEDPEVKLVHLAGLGNMDHKETLGELVSGKNWYIETEGLPKYLCKSSLHQDWHYATLKTHPT